MKKVYLLLLTLLVFGFEASAKHVPAETARKAAQHYLQQFTAARFSGDLELVHQEVSKASSPVSRKLPLAYFYVFSQGKDGGLVFVSADDKVRPILGYTLKGDYNPASMPPQLLKWLENYKSEVRYAIEQLPENKESAREWQNLLEGKSQSTSSRIQQTVVPLLTTTWDQSPFYNDLCPYDADAGELTLTGCVATAMAQIMKYWEYPAKGSGFHSYNHETLGTISANFSGTTYNWQEMPDNLSSGNPAVATLMKHLGVSVEMDYGVEASGAYVISAGSPIEHCSEYALKTYFGYKEVKGVIRDNYELSSWIQLLKAELDAGQPILYAGAGSGGGHAFVCDGYDAEDNFHMNWGWGGYYDGYFAISALNPEGLGAGGGTGGYNTGQEAVIGIKAPDAAPGDETLDLQLNADVTIDISSIGYGQAFAVHTDIINKGSTSFKGDFGAAAFDGAGNFVDWIKTYSNVALSAGYHYTEGVLFDTPGLLSLLPGEYQVFVFYKTTDGQWEKLTGGGFTDHAFLTVFNDNALELSSSISIEGGGQLYQGGELSANSAVKNAGDSPFSGWVDLSLYDLNGNFVFTIDQQELDLCAGCSSETIQFQNAALDVAPGSYMMVVQHYAEPEGWQLTGAGLHSNPLNVVVQLRPLAGDAYESNDEVETAYELPLSLNNNNARITTPEANIHLDTDYDYYKVRFPEGYQYELSAEVQDFYNAENNTSFSNDVLFSVSEDGIYWTDAYDDKMPTTLLVEGGSTIYFFVAPYFQGETGTYLLDLNISRGAPTAVSDKPLPLASLKVFPNPTAGRLQLDTELKCEYAELSSISGKLLQRFKAGEREFDLSRYESGVYLLRIKTEKGFQVQKVVKQ